MSMSKHSLAVGRGILTVQYARQLAEGEQPDINFAQMFQDVVDRSPLLRRLTAVQQVGTTSFGELRCDAEYGPERGSEAALHRHMRRHVREIAAGALDAEVFGFSCSHLGPENVAVIVADLAARIGDTNLPLSPRKQFEVLMTKYTRLIPAGPSRVRLTVATYESVGHSHLVADPREEVGS
jgi:hypothetical protein